jgi:TrmH family RNA methyltransferase
MAIFPHTFPILSQNRKKLIASLSRKKEREASRLFLVEGLRSVQSALEAHANLIELVVAEHTEVEAEMVQEARKQGIPIFSLPDKSFAQLSDVQSSQGILAVAKMSALPIGHLQHSARILALGGVQDPGNVGTLIRTAAWFGINAILADEASADFYNAKVVRASMGGIWDVDLFQVKDLYPTLEELKPHFTLYSADLTGTSLNEWQPKSPSILVMGSEAHGISQKIANLTNEMIHIPRKGLMAQKARNGVESLNVGVAAGILMELWAR